MERSKPRRSRLQGRFSAVSEPAIDFVMKVSEVLKLLQRDEWTSAATTAPNFRLKMFEHMCSAPLTNKNCRIAKFNRRFEPSFMSISFRHSAAFGKRIE